MHNNWAIRPQRMTS